MKGLIRFVAALAFLATTPPAMGAAFINVRWADCNGAVNQTFNCVSAAGTFQVICSFDPGTDYTGPNAVLAGLGIVDIIATSLSATTLPEFWQFQAGGCTPTRMTFSSDFTAFGTCADMWGGGAGGGGQFGGKGGPVPEGNTARIKWAWATTGAPIDIVNGTEYYIAAIRFSKSTTACPGGCTDPVCLVYNEVQLGLLSGAAPQIFVDSGGSSPPYVTWQDAGNSFNCPIPTPVRTRTWGEIKALYR